MVVYEVTIAMDAAIREDYLRWLEGHAREIVALPGVVRARAFEVTEPAAHGQATVCVRYRFVDEAALDAYLRDHAPRLREQGLARFGGRMQASRRIMRPLFAIGG